MTIPFWTLQAWAWLKKNWRWVLFPLGIALAILGWTRRTNVTLASSSLLEADQNAKELADRAAAQNSIAKAVEAAKIQAADHELDVDVAVVQDHEKAAAPVLIQDPDALNKMLLDVGKRNRGPS